MATEALIDRLKHQIVAVTIAYPHNTDLRDLLIDVRNVLRTSLMEHRSPEEREASYWSGPGCEDDDRD